MRYSRFMMSAAGFLLLLGNGAATGPARAASLDPIGATVAIVNLVTAEFNRDTRSLKVGDRVHQNEKIEVGLDAQGELRFDDDTKLALGPGARLTLDKFVYDPAKSSGSIVLNLAKGAFRFITGLASKPTYVVRTPVAAITVRGTIFDVYIMDDDVVWLLLHEGAVEVCNARKKCVVLDEPGKLMRITSNGDVGVPVRWASLPGRERTPFARAFPFVIKAPSIDPTPILTEAAITGGNDTMPPVTGPKKPRDASNSAPPSSDTPSKPTKPGKKADRKGGGESQPSKKTKTAKKGSDYTEQIMTGMDVVIGIGGAIGKIKGGSKGKHQGGGYPSSTGGMKPSGGGMKMPGGDVR